MHVERMVNKYVLCFRTPAMKICFAYLSAKNSNFYIILSNQHRIEDKCKKIHAIQCA